jgi:hypothetical protein
MLNKESEYKKLLKEAEDYDELIALLEDKSKDVKDKILQLRSFI